MRHRRDGISGLGHAGRSWAGVYVNMASVSSSATWGWGGDEAEDQRPFHL